MRRLPRPRCGRLLSRSYRLLLASVAAAMSMSSASAQSSPAAYLASIDSNGDARVDLAEFHAWMIHGFDLRDVDANGVLDIDEQPWSARRRPISRRDRLRALEEAFHRQDRNGDGYLDAAELGSPPG